MRHAAAVFALLAASAFADRAARPMQLNRTGVAPEDGRFGFVGEKFAAREGLKLRLHALDGAEPADLFTFSEAPESWWIAPDGKHVAWTCKGVLHLTAIGGADRELGKAPDGEASFSANGARLAFVRGFAIVGIDTATGKATEIAGNIEREYLGPPALSGDGNRAYVLSGIAPPEAGEGPEPPDRLDCAAFDQGVLLPIWSLKEGSILGLSSSGALPTEDKRDLPPGHEDRLAFVRARKDKAELCVWNGEDGRVTPVLETESLSMTAISRDASWVAVTGPAKSGRIQAWAVDTHRTGSMQEYAVDPLAEVEGAHVFSLRLSPAGESLFVALPEKPGGRREIVGAGPRWR